MKKAKIKSALKEIQQELTRMDIRISKLEPTGWTKYQDETRYKNENCLLPLPDPKNVCIKPIGVLYGEAKDMPLGFWKKGIIDNDIMQDETLIDKKTESFHKQASMQKNETELKELPERWEVVVNKENRNALNNYRMNVCGIKNPIPLKYERMTDDGSGNDKGNGCFTEISFPDFERLVLKKEQNKEQPKEIDWSVPMLVECDDFIIQTTGVNDNDKFSGVVIKVLSDVIHKKGEYRDSWRKTGFKPVTEPITINKD